MNESAKLYDMEDLFRQIIDNWEELPRWRGKSDVSDEDVLAHTWKTALQALTALSLEESLGDSKLDKFRILACAILHDVGEACVAVDVIHPIKSDPRFEGIWDEIEYSEFKAWFGQIFEPHILQFFSEAYCTCFIKSTTEGRFFDALEKYGYAAFAVEEMFMPGAKNERIVEFDRVLLRTHEELANACGEFKGIGALYEPLRPSAKSGARPRGWVLEPLLRSVVTDWKRTSAWPGLRVKEKLLERTFKTCLLALAMIAYELALGKTKFDAFKVLGTVCVHKMDKVYVPPLSQVIKKKLSAQKKIKVWHAIQPEHFQKLIDGSPPSVSRFLFELFTMKHDRRSFEGRFFDAIKNLSYILFAYYEYKDGAPSRAVKFAEVFTNCYRVLERYSREFPSIAAIYDPVRDEIRQAVKKKK